MGGPLCMKCGRIHCQISDLPHDASTPQQHPGFEHLKPVDFDRVLSDAMKGVEVVKSTPDSKKPKGPRPPKRAPAKRYKQQNAPKAEKGSLIGGGDVRRSAAEKAKMVKELGGDPSKIFTGGELPKGGPLVPYEGSRKIDVEFFPDLPANGGAN